MRRVDTQTEAGIFTRYLRTLDPGGEPPDATSFEAVWEALRGALHWELRRRGLWRLAPNYLGVIGFGTWTDPETRARTGHRCDALEELTSECYAYTFVHRIAGLRAQSKAKPNVDGLVFLNVRHFVQERQARHDPLGTRIFSLLRAVVHEALEDGRLHVIDGDAELRGRTILAFSVGAKSSAATPEAELEPLVECWNDDLLPDLVTTRGKGQPRLLARIGQHLDELAQHGVEVFAFKSLVDLVKADVRRRWAAVYEVTLGEWAMEGLDEEWARVVPLVKPETDFEDRDSFRRLAECVAREIASLPSVYGDLRAIWDLLVSWAADPGGLPAAEEAPLSEATAPSRREIARQLGIPRDRLPRLYEMLGRALRTCREAVAGPTPAGARMDDDLRERLRQTTGQAMARAVRAEEERRSPSGPRPGDVYVLAADTSPALEWVVLDLEDDGGVLVVPADTRPFAGRADVAVPEDAPGGPLTLRCGHAVTLPSHAFDPNLRTRHLASDRHERALDVLRREEQGTLEGSPLEEEIEHDPVYTEWLAEVASAVRSVSATAAHEPSAEQEPGGARTLRFPTAPDGRRMPRRWLEGLAAVLAVAVVGLSAFVWLRQPPVDPRTGPYFVPPVEPIVLRDPDRRPLTWRLGPTTEQLLLELIFLDPPLCENLRLEFLDAEGQLLWAHDDLDIPDMGEIKLVLPRSFLEQGPARLRLLGRCDGETRLLDERRLDVRRTR